MSSARPPDRSAPVSNRVTPRAAPSDSAHTMVSATRDLCQEGFALSGTRWFPGLRRFSVPMLLTPLLRGPRNKAFRGLVRDGIPALAVRAVRADPAADLYHPESGESSKEGGRAGARPDLVRADQASNLPPVRRAARGRGRVGGGRLGRVTASLSIRSGISDQGSEGVGASWGVEQKPPCVTPRVATSRPIRSEALLAGLVLNPPINPRVA